ncbi:2-dehydropantoate 2-reductase [Alteromonas sp. CYL-A6]|uniref:2-dehydropantoate 2-reductase n=1 Tax=Alteromonas nitratireducens TaxID=3390813 RepID=UPI0034AD7A1A
MHHVIVGSGLIGSYLGCMLSENGEQVSVVARGSWAKRLSSAVQVSDYTGKQCRCGPLPLHDITSNTGGAPDVIWLTVKCTAVDSAIETLKLIAGPKTRILCCQNGIGSHQSVQAAFPHHTVLRVMVPFNVVWQEPDRLHRGSEGTLVIEQHHDAGALQKALQHAMLPVAVADDIEAVQWAKLQLNLGNGVNALADIPVKAMLSERGYRRIIADLMAELLTVCAAAGRPLPKVAKLPGHWLPHLLRLPDWLFSRLASQMLAIDPNVKTSMWWDIQAGNTTEQDYLYGAVVREGQRLGIPCPWNAAMQSLLRGAEKQRRETGRHSGFSAQALRRQLETQINRR